MGNSCRIDGCDKRQQRGGLCWTHDWRKRNGKDMGAEVEKRLPPPKRLEVTANKLGNASSEDDEAYQKARDLLRKHAKRYAQWLAGMIPQSNK